MQPSTEVGVPPLRAVAEKLDRIADLMALTLVRPLEEEAEQIRLLNAVGYAPARIGALLGKRPNTVSATLSRQKRQKATAAPRKKATAKKATRKRPTRRPRT